LAAGELFNPASQDTSVGRSYRFINRTLWHDVVMWLLLRTGRIRRQIEGIAGLPFPVSGAR
jgi:hypothetical protein